MAQSPCLDTRRPLLLVLHLPRVCTLAESTRHFARKHPLRQLRCSSISIHLRARYLDTTQTVEMDVDLHYCNTPSVTRL
ncbi:hypothetical protein BKA58DRAFT_377633, partial [Alternaria rosae]|uniref:uncharacterized protein n=1 Tax=Alternaria rosae TaxID=1187941 RepID=UPI001E8D7CC1